MAARKRASSRSRRSGLVGRAVRAGRKALRDAESRVPPDLRKQIERTVKEGQKTVMSAVHELETRVNRSARQADVDKALKRLEGLTKQVQQLARGTASRGAARATSTRRRAASTTRRAKTAVKKKATTARRATATRKRAAPKPAARRAAPKAAAAKPAARRTSARRTPARRTSARAPEVRSVPEPPAPGPIPESVDMGGGA
jgi:polyhydroxyalkanoate synthesis regulator phasin